MPNAAYLRRQAETCIRLARTTFDLATAERLRFMAADMSAKADQIDDESDMQPHFMKSNGSSRNGESNHG